METLLGIAGSVFAVVVLVFLAFSFRVVVSTNETHILQRVKSTVSYGKDQPSGNVYYRWPAWIPFLGVRVSVLPVSVFAQNLNDYAAYDKGRVPFVIDVVGFFRIVDSNVAAQRVSDMKQLVSQLEYILKGAIRTILASSEIEEILEGRSKFGEMFTKEVDAQLGEWGVHSVKCLELMDIRDANDSKVISNIMAKKKSLIESQSRIEVAKNIQTAMMAEVDAKRAVDIRNQEAQEQVGIRTAEREQQVGIQTQKAFQAVKEQERETAVRTMAVVEVQTVRKAEIDRATQLVVADQTKQTKVIYADGEKQQNIIHAEGERQQTILVADGQLEAAKRNAEAIRVEGVAKGEAEQAILMAPVNSQITLAKEIGQNGGYQAYLITIRQIEAGQVVGVEQAKALEKATIKVIANTGSGPVDGVKDVMGLFTPKGGTMLGAALEAFKSTDAGAALLARANGAAEAH